MINKIEQSTFYKKIYDMEDYTINDLLCSFFKKINECIDLSNESFNYLEWLKNEGLENETSEILNNWLEDGTLEELININKFNELSTELTNKIDKLISDSNTTITELIDSITLQINSLDSTLSQKVENMKKSVDTKLSENETFVNNAVTNMNHQMDAFENVQNSNFENLINNINTQLSEFKNFIIVTNVNEFKNAIEKCGTIPTIIYLVNGDVVQEVEQ